MGLPLRPPKASKSPSQGKGPEVPYGPGRSATALAPMVTVVPAAANATPCVAVPRGPLSTARSSLVGRRRARRPPTACGGGATNRLRDLRRGCRGPGCGRRATRIASDAPIRFGTVLRAALPWKERTSRPWSSSTPTPHSRAPATRFRTTPGCAWWRLTARPGCAPSPTWRSCRRRSGRGDKTPTSSSHISCSTRRRETRRSGRTCTRSALSIPLSSRRSTPSASASEPGTCRACGYTRTPEMAEDQAFDAKVAYELEKGD